jgi:ubiquinone/menaquinone biosynthesis C-methylase UbiE
MKSLSTNDAPYGELTGYHSEVSRVVKSKFIKNKTVLDVGCGFGWAELLFSKLNPKHMVGVDYSEECLVVARKFKHPSCSFKKGDALQLPFKDNTFDTVISFEVLEHIPKHTEDKMFSELYRVLKPGGHLFLSTQHRNFFSTVLDPAWWLIGHRHYTQNAIKEFAKNSGFKINQLYIKGGFYTIFGILNMYISKWIFHRPPLNNSFFIAKTEKEFAQDTGKVYIFLLCSKS